MQNRQNRTSFESYLIVGDGRVAGHFRHYFSLEGIAFDVWARSSSDSASSQISTLESKIQSSSHILLLISDSAIDTFYSEHSSLQRKTCIHFSGAHVSRSVAGAHPLMTFSHSLYDLQTYRQIPFVIERDRLPTPEPLPKLLNPVFEIDSEQKGLYHALCVLSGNFTTLLWEKVFREFDQALGLPKEALLPYLKQTTENLSTSGPGQSVLTGPFVRNDEQTIKRHLDALGTDPFADVYRSFIRAFRDSQKTGRAR